MEQQHSSTQNPVAVRAPSTIADIPIPRQNQRPRLSWAVPTPVMIPPAFRILKLQRLSFSMGFLQSNPQLLQCSNIPWNCAGKKFPLSQFSIISNWALALSCCLLFNSLFEIMPNRYISCASMVMIRALIFKGLLPLSCAEAYSFLR